MSQFSDYRANNGIQNDCSPTQKNAVSCFTLTKYFVLDEKMCKCSFLTCYVKFSLLIYCWGLGKAGPQATLNISSAFPNLLSPEQRSGFPLVIRYNPICMPFDM